MLESPAGVYWIATNGGGVCRYAPGETSPEGRPVPFTAYHVGDAPWSNRVNALHRDRAGHLWAGTDGGLFRLEERDGATVFRLVLAGTATTGSGAPIEVRALAEDGHATLWVATATGLFRRSVDGHVAEYGTSLRAGDPAADLRTVRSMVVDRVGRLWAGTGAGIYIVMPAAALTPDTVSTPWRRLVRPRGAAPADAPSDDVVPTAVGDAYFYPRSSALSRLPQLQLLRTSDDHIWIAGDVGMTEFDGRRLRHYQLSANFGPTALKGLGEDESGNLWLVSDDGVLRVAPHGLTSYDKDRDLSGARPAAMFENVAGDLFTVDSALTIHRFDGERFAPVRPRLPGVTAMGWGWQQVTFQDRGGDWWIATGQGLHRFAGVSRFEDLARRSPTATYTERSGLSGDDIFRLFEDSRGDIWIGTNSPPKDRLTRWERATGRFHRYTEADGLAPFNPPTAFAEDRSGGVWIGFYNGGLVRYRGGRFVRLTERDGLPRGRINALYVDRAGRLWLASGTSGVARVDRPEAERPQAVRYTTREGLASDSIACITEDLAGRMYFGGVRGIDQLLDAGRMRHYTTNDGLPDSLVLFAHRDRRGTLWFGTLKGLARLVPEPAPRVRPPSVFIGAVRVNEEYRSLSDLGESTIAPFTLAAGRDRLHLEFFSLAFDPGDVPRFQYKLEGTDGDWSPPTAERVVNYALRPGAYRFLVRAVNAAGIVSPTQASMAFAIQAPLWQRWWVLTLAAIALGLATFALYRVRVARLIDLERMRMRIATDLHDDIGASLSQIAILSEVARQELAGDNPPANETLSSIAGTARELVDGMSDIVWAINPRNDSLADLTQRMRRFAADLLCARAIDVQFSAPSQAEPLALGADLRRQVFLVFKESVTNSVRHSGCGTIAIDLSVSRDALRLRVTDDGRGLPVSRNGDGDGHGLASMQARATALGGTLTVTPRDGGGTTVTLSAPLARGYTRMW